MERREPETLFRANYRQTLLFGYPPSDTDFRNLIRASEGLAVPRDD